MKVGKCSLTTKVAIRVNWIVAGSKAFHADGSLSKFFDAIHSFSGLKGLMK